MDLKNGYRKNINSKDEIYNKQDILFHIGFTIKCLVSGAVKFRT